MALPNNQSVFPKKPGKALSVMVEAPGYPVALALKIFEEVLTY
jgi:hypothetical protein